jgi:hypothetical protein
MNHRMVALWSVLAGAAAVLVLLSGDAALAQGRGVRRGPPPTAGRPPVAGKPADVGRPPAEPRPEETGAQRRGRGAGPARERRGHPSGPRDERSLEALQRNPRLAERVRDLLPPGTDLQAAAAGFRNLGQFLAAVHVAHNLGLPFDQVKAKVVGEGLSLGEAIHLLKGDVDAKHEAERAERAAREMMRSTRQPRGSR